MARPQRESFVIQVRSSSAGSEGFQADQTRASPHRNLNFSAMKLFDRFRKIVIRFIIFSLPSSSSIRSRATSESVPWRRSCDRRPDTPKASFSGGSSYYSSISHYNEAISDCIEFFNKSSQEGIFCASKSDLVV
ncbi:hypothetical protein U1Q18_005970 [Sarracenia purpurea var. burkii]